MGYLGLFFSAFLAATVLPFASEIPLALFVRARGNVAGAVAVVTVGNFLGACTTYALARGLFGRRVSLGEGSASRALRLFRRYGAPALLLSWLPIIGDGIVAAAGAARVPLVLFSILTVVGKGVRYAAVAWLALRA